MLNKLIYFLAKFGIVVYRGRLVLAENWFVSDTDQEDDNCIYYYSVYGRELPFLKKVKVPLEYDGKYRDLVKKVIKPL